MLTEQRHRLLLELVNEKKSITVTEAKEVLNASESTIRRDIIALHNAGKLTKVFGGAVALEEDVITEEPSVEQRVEQNKEEKYMIAEYVASLIKPGDFVYIDAGTTTGYMLNFLKNSKSVFVTNAVTHAKKLALQGNKVILIEGELKGSTEALVGGYAAASLKKFHFSKGFFGTNGLTKKAGFTTPDTSEALVKNKAMEQCKECYVLADQSKFDKISPVTFQQFGRATIITESKPEGYMECENIIVVREN